jgi:hypothetical protein
VIGSAIDQICSRFQVFRRGPSAKKTAGLIEKETDVSYDLHGIRLRAQGVCMRFNQIIIVLVVVLVLVLEIRILSRTKDEDEHDDDKVHTL